MKLAMAAGMISLFLWSGLPACAGGDLSVQPPNQVLLGAELYQFHPEKVRLSLPNSQMVGEKMFRLTGKFLPRVGEPIRVEMTAAQDGRLYTLKLNRRRKNDRSEDIWAATLKTRIEVLEFQPKPGGKLRLRCSGPLAATLKEGGSQTVWSGEILAFF